MLAVTSSVGLTHAVSQTTITVLASALMVSQATHLIHDRAAARKNPARPKLTVHPARSAASTSVGKSHVWTPVPSCLVVTSRPVPYRMESQCASAHLLMYGIH